MTFIRSAYCVTDREPTTEASRLILRPEPTGEPFRTLSCQHQRLHPGFASHRKRLIPQVISGQLSRSYGAFVRYPNPSQFAMLSDLPYIKSIRDGEAHHLIVDGAPFILRAAELHNSSSSSPAYMSTVWPRLAAMHINTVLGAICWDRIEPVEGQFDFSDVQKIIHGAQEHQLKLVFLWFGAYKNGEPYCRSSRNLDCIISGVAEQHRPIMLCSSLGEDQRRPISPREDHV